MKKNFISALTVFTFLLSSTLFADAKEVPIAAKESSLVYEKTNWQPWVVALITIAIATTGLVIVSSNRD